MKKLLSCFIIILVTLFQCERNHFKQEYGNYETFKSFPQQETWKFNRLPGPNFYLPTRIKIMQDRYLFISEDTDEKMIQIYNIEDGRLIKAFGKKGKGPGEYFGPPSILYCSDNPDYFWAHDFSSLKIERYTLNDVLGKNRCKPDSTMKISADAGIPAKLALLSSNEFVAIGSLKSRLCFFDSNGDTIRTNGYVPGTPTKGASKRVHMQLYSGRIITNSKANRIAICNGETDMLEIYDWDGKIVKTLHGPDIFINDYGCVDEYGLAVDRKQCGYFGICSSSQYIYAGYSGRKPKSQADWTAGLGREIFVFDWDGTPIKRAEVNYTLAYMEYSEERNTIYAVCYDGEEFFIGYHQLEVK